MPAKKAIDEKPKQETHCDAKFRKRRAAMEQGLSATLCRQEKVRRYRGRLDWQGDLDAMRNGL